MPAIARMGDMVMMFLRLATSSTVVATTTKGFANNKAIGKVGDKTTIHLHYWGSHWWPLIGNFQTGSNKDFLEGKGVLRVGDIADCGCRITAGSPNSFSE